MRPSDKPVLIFDGRCGFCRIWIDYWKALTGDAVAYAPYQEVASEYPEIDIEQLKRAVHLVLPDGRVLKGAHAVFQSVAFNPVYRLPLRVYESSGLFARVTEAVYRTVAAHRDFFYWWTVLLFGRKVQPLHYERVQWLFLRILGLIWIIAFVSFGVQASGLIGSHGVQPVSLFLDRVAHVLGARGWLAAPTLFWISSSDTAIRTVWIAGALCGALVFSGVLWRAALAAAFVLYLSLMNGSQEFLSYQWDILLLETGFLSCFLGYSRAIVWMFRWLAFRLMFLSGAVKLLSGDPTWRNLTALQFHFQTQPIPTPLAWYAHHLPGWFLKLSCFGVFVIELGFALMVFGPRRLRRIGACGLIALQVMILLTGNYAFFNWLSIALCLFLVDDEWLRSPFKARAHRSRLPHGLQRSLARSAVAIVAILSSLFFVQALRGKLPGVADALMSFAAPFGISSSYGLFASMTTVRPEIVIEGSVDGVNWRAYEFKYKPGRLERPPPWVAPHQPRLDWQMWFAALGSYQDNVWFLNLLARLLQGTPEVLKLLDGNPFPEGPPKLIRARMYEYRFSGPGTASWWTRRPAGLYVPAVSLEDLSRLPLLQYGR